VEIKICYICFSGIMSEFYKFLSFQYYVVGLRLCGFTTIGDI
jgi:hypothetical protein